MAELMECEIIHIRRRSEKLSSRGFAGVAGYAGGAGFEPVFTGGKPCKTEKKINPGADLRPAISKLIHSIQAVTPAGRDVHIELGVRETVSTPSNTPSKLSAIELAKAVAPLRALTETKADFDALKAQFVDAGSAARVDQILDGTGQEDEFALFCRAMQTCESCARLDQTPVVKSDEKIADFLVSFRPGVSVKGLRKEDVGVRFNCFVEVKSSSKPNFSISKKDLQARRRFANRFGLPLVLAVRFRNFQSHTVWILMEAEFLERRGRKIGCADLIDSITHVLFDDYGLYAIPNLHLIHFYDNANGPQGVGHPEWGTMTGMSLLTKETPVPMPADTFVLASALFHNFEQTVVHTESEGTRTAVVSAVGHQMRLLSDLVFSLNYLARSETGESTFNPRRVLASLDSDESPLFFTRSMVENLITRINNADHALLMLAIGEPDHQEKVLKKLSR